MNIKTRKQLEKRHPAIGPLAEGLPAREPIDRIFQRIAERAYTLFTERGCRNGHDLEDWLAAEEQLFRKAPCEVAERGNEIMVKAEVPGFNERDLDVKVDADRIYITGHKETVVPAAPGDRMRDERDYRDVFRVVTLPVAVLPEKATATLHEGILTVFVPKIAVEKLKSEQAVA